MENLNTYTLEELSIGKGRYGIPAPAIPFNSSKYTYLRITDINDDGSLNKENLMSVDAKNIDNFVLRKNDIVFARTGNSTGRSYFYDGSDGKLVYAGFLVKFSIDEKKVNPRILKYYTHSKRYFDWIHSFDTGGTRGNINAKTYGKMPITLPPRWIQNKIVNILKSLDDKIELNNKINRNLEAQAQAIFKSWFIDFEPFKNGKFIDSELGRIPEGWVCKKLKDFVEIKRGSSPRPIQDYLSGSGYNWLKISDATSESSPFIFNIKEHIKKSGISQTVYLVAGELVLSNSATPGIPKFLDVNTCIHDGWLWFSNSKLSYEFLYLFFLHKRRDFISLGNGSVFTNLKTDIVKDALFVYPNKAVMDEFDKITKTIFENIKIRSRESQRLTQLRDALLPKLMSGEIDVTDIAV